MEQLKSELETKSFPTVRLQSIGKSELGRPLVAHQIGEQRADFRVLVLAGQHGNERIARQAALKLIDSIKSEMIDLSNIFISIIPDCNPDGAASNTRMNAKGVDLNRDHQRLESAEIQALHAFVRSFKPHLIEDAHNYPPRRKHLLSRNWIMDQDIFIDVPTHPAVRLSINEEDFHSMFTSVQSDLRSKGFTCDRYVLLRPSGRVRHSTLDLRDARNSLSLRYGSFVVLIEGRTPSKKERENGNGRIVKAEHDAMVSMIRWGQTHSNLLGIGSSSPGLYCSDDQSSPLRIPIRFGYESFNETLDMTFVNSVSGKREKAQLEHFASKPRITETVQLPIAYAVMKEKIGVIEILQRHGFGFTPSRSNDAREVEVFKHTTLEEKNDGTIRRGKPKKLSRRVVFSAVRCKRSLDRYVIFPSLNQEGGITLALFLEPNSKSFLGRYEDLGLDAISGESPIMRVIS